MTASKPRVLFISHSASRNGASILLLNYVKWLTRQVDWDIQILVDGSGPLVDDYAAVARTHVIRGMHRLCASLPSRARNVARRATAGLMTRAIIGGARFDLLYANTIAAWPFLMALRAQSRRVVWHIHELEYALDAQIEPERGRALLARVDGVIAAATKVRETLLEKYQVRPSKVETIHEFTPIGPRGQPRRQVERIATLRAMGWPAHSFVVGGSGSLGWRKGTDLFLQIARIVRSGRERGDVRFLWVGGEREGSDAQAFDEGCRVLGLTDFCARVSTTDDVSRYYEAMDVFALTSREDPFPLVMLEAALNELPIVCFEESGGGPEFAQEDAGVIVKFEDVESYADQLLRLKGDPTSRHRLGRCAASRVVQEFSQETQAPKILDVLQRHLVRA